MNTISTKCSYDKSFLLRYANLAFKNQVIYNGLKEYIEKNNLLVTISHPYEFFENSIITMTYYLKTSIHWKKTSIQ